MAKRRLTARQQAFVDAYLAGNPPSEAYKSAYNTSGMSAATIATEAWRLLHRPHIAHIIDEIKKGAVMRSTWSRARAIERLEKVNDKTFDAIIEGGASRDEIRAFFDSEQRLGELIDLPFETELRRRGINNSIANASEFAVLHQPEWNELQQFMKIADEEKEVDDA